MTTYYVGPGGNDGNAGTSWALRKLTLNGAEDIPVAAGDVVYVAPGVYRETLTCDVSGGNTYSAGTVNVTNGSTLVSGTSTAFSANVGADYQYHVRYYAQSTTGYANGTATFADANGNFQADMVGVPIQINAKGAYMVAGYTSATQITLSDPNALGWPGAGTGTYSIMSGEGHYEIETVVSDVELTLKQPWQGRTLNGLAYLTFQPITYIGDVTGEHTDVGGVVRITGSDDDQTATRADIIIDAQDYRLFRGFTMDTTTVDIIDLDGNHLILEDCVIQGSQRHVYVGSSITGITIRRCYFLYPREYWCFLNQTTTDTGHVLENCFIFGARFYALRIANTGGVTVRNCNIICGGDFGIRVGAAITTGQTLYCVNNQFICCGVALQGTAAGEITENYNNFFDNAADRTTVATGANSISYTPSLTLPILHAGADQLSGYKFPWTFGELSQWSQIAAITGTDERNTDMFGIRRPAQAYQNSWGPVQYSDVVRATGTTRGASAASLEIDAWGRHHMYVPVAAEATTIEVYANRETSYSGTAPQMIIKQPGQPDQVTTDSGGAGSWNQLTHTFTGASIPPYVVVELVNNNVTGSASVFFDDLSVS